ncbi:hypothetical protein ADM96_07780 [Burkholderia sp. ST111]|nr:hypothetical protein ADM96_07780 [Burkholderia sp. ST111]
MQRGRAIVWLKEKRRDAQSPNQTSAATERLRKTPASGNYGRRGITAMNKLTQVLSGHLK